MKQELLNTLVERKLVTDNTLVYANVKNSQEFKIYKNSKVYILESRKNKGTWRKLSYTI